MPPRFIYLFIFLLVSGLFCLIYSNDDIDGGRFRDIVDKIRSPPVERGGGNIAVDIECTIRMGERERKTRATREVEFNKGSPCLFISVVATL